VTFTYSLRNLLRRRLTSGMTAGGIAIAALVMLVSVSMILGVDHTMGSTGSPRNVLVMSRGARSENSSTLTTEVVSQLRAHPGASQVSPEVVASGRAASKDGSAQYAMGLRGIEAGAFQVHAGVRIVEGRAPKTSENEAVLGKAAARQLEGIGVGQKVRVLDRDWAVVGILDSGGTAFESQIWMDAADLKHALKRDQVTTVVLRAGKGIDAEALAGTLNADPRFEVKAMPEAAYYEEQNTLSAGMKDFALILGAVISLAAILAAMNNMFASMGERRKEVATMRALGFAPSTILGSFLFEGAILGLAGAAVACALSLPLGLVSMSMLDPVRWSNVTFQFRLTPELFAGAAVLGVFLGVLGALAPARAVVRAPIVETLKEL